MAAAAGAVGGAVVALLIVFLMRPQAPRPITRQSDTVAAQPVHETTRDAAPAVQPPTPVRADALPGANWANRFLWLSENAPKRLSSVVTSIAGGDAMLSGEMEKSLTPIRAQLDAGTPLAPADRKLLRGILFQMLARQISGRDFKIDGRFASVPGAAVTAVRNELHLESKAANSDDIANFEGEAVLKWAARENL
jgi:hypothetical protein